MMATVLAFLVLAGCGSREPASDAQATPPAATAPAADTTQSTENELPAQFPTDFPLPEQYEVVYTAWQDDIGGLVLFRSDASDEEVRQRFESGLGEAGWILISCQIMTEPTQMTIMSATKGEQIASVTIGSQQAPQQGAFEGEYSFSVSIILTPPQGVSGASPATCQEFGSGS